MSKSLLVIRKIIILFFFFVTIKVTAQPAISSFSPSSGIPGTSITITGTNFNATAANNIVYFGAVRATVTAGTTTSLTVTAPAGATFKPISVLDNVTHLAAYSSKPFIITFANPFGTGIPANFYKSKVDFATNGTPYSVAYSDIDGDGKADLVVANQTNSVSVLRNTSTMGDITSSSFAAKTDLVPGNVPYSVAVGDVDGDGKPDIIIANSSSATISVLRNTSTAGSISAAAKVDFATGSFPISVVISDVDGDGKPDIIVANSGSSTISVFRNTSVAGMIDASSFAGKVDFVTGTTPYGIAVADVDGDGKTDVITANQNSNNISILRNTSTPGSISIAVKVDFTTGSTPRSVAAGDVDGDGKTDLVVANYNSNTVSVLRNTSSPGTIGIATKVDFATGTNPRSVAIGDLDGDGKPDFVATNNTSPYSISVFQNTSVSGSITAAAKVDFTTATSAVSVAIGDVDGDGIPEIATANSASSSVSVFQINLSITPVTLTDVRAYEQNTGVKIEWTAQQEINIDRYEIERSQNGQQFIKLGSVQAKGNVSALTRYNFFDADALNGVSFYRIKIIEEGHITYTPILKININSIPVNMVNISPNPINGNIISLQMNLPKGTYTVSVSNRLGQELLTKKINYAGGISIENIASSKVLAPGIYQLMLSGTGINITRQILKN